MGIDTITQGAWIGKYGTTGYAIANGPTKNPDYTVPSLASGFTYTWAGAVNDVRVLQNSAGSTVGIASAFTNYGNSSVNVNLSGYGPVHQVALYMLDWDSTSRSQTVTIIDANTNTVQAGPSKAEANLGRHKISFKTATRVFDDPSFHLIKDWTDETGESRWHAIGTAEGVALL